MSAFSDYLESAIAAYVLRGVAMPAIAGRHVQIHTGDPGEAGTANVVSGPSRVAATFNTSNQNNADLTFTGVPAVTVSHVSIWDAATGGNCLYKGALTTPKTIGNAGDSFVIPATSLTVTHD